MRILVSDDSNLATAHYPIRLGICRSLDISGHTIFMHNTHTIPYMDVFDDFKPELIIAQSYNINSAFIKWVSENPKCKVVLTGSDWSKFSNDIDIDKYPILRANKKEIALVEKLNKIHKIDLIICHYHNNNIHITHEYWKDKLGIPILGLPPAADIFDYTNGKYMEEFKSDIFFCGGKWGYKSRTIDPWFLPLCNTELNLNIKIFGNKNWGIHQFCGNLEQKWFKHAMASAKVCPNISEPHAQIYGIELNERCFKNLSNKCTVVSDYTESLAKDIFNNGEVEFAKNPLEFKEKILAVIAGDLTIDPQVGYDKVMSEHTYFHRMSYMFSCLGLSKESDNVLGTFQKVREVNEI